MSDTRVDMRGGVTIGATELLERAAAEELCAHRALSVVVDDFFLPDDGRLDEHMRAALGHLLRALVETVESELRGHAARLLSAGGEPKLAEALGDAEQSVLPRLLRAQLLRDPELMAELTARVRQELMCASLPIQAPEEPERPNLINRYVQHSDRVLATGAMAVMIAESRRRTAVETGQLQQTDLPAELHHRLVWWVAAALRERALEHAGDNREALDAALVDAAKRSLAAHDEGDRLESAALRFAAALDPQDEELAELLVESLNDRQLVVFTALFARTLGISYELARDLVLSPSAARLWVALRAKDLTRENIAKIGYALCEADSRRDLETFADALDAVAAIPPEEARRAIASLKLHPDYRAALNALQRSERGT